MLSDIACKANAACTLSETCGTTLGCIARADISAFECARCTGMPHCPEPCELVTYCR